MQISINGIEMYYEKYGKGQPLIMVHGNGEDHSIFEEAVAKLKRRFTCYVVDSRGHGQSTQVDSLSYVDMAEDMIAFMNALNLEHVVFYGFSDGGIIGLLVASSCDLVDKLIISGANLNPLGIKPLVYLGIKAASVKTKDPKLLLMTKEPDITDAQLHMIQAKTLVLAGSHDLIRLHHTRHIAREISGSKLRILKGEDHGSYIIHSEKIARIIWNFAR